MKNSLICILIVVCCAGCGTTVPFALVERVSVAALDPTVVRAKFKKAMPERFQIVNSAIFRYRGREMTGIGYVSVDMKKKAVAVACMNPLGIKLFNLEGTNGQYQCSLALKDVVSREDFARVAGMDIGNTFLNILPAQDSIVRKTQDSIIFSQTHPGGRQEYVFAGTDGVLIEKRSFDGRKLSWRIRYYEYQKQGGKLLPRGIVLENKKYSYSLVIRLKEVVVVKF
ncbi:MAG: DUF4292 domain-containing protein [Kiritimatiellae bacterium]|nr:DUF4292 domain-containing protein [Kiritimatiellia bacterium]